MKTTLYICLLLGFVLATASPIYAQQVSKKAPPKKTATSTPAKKAPAKQPVTQAKVSTPGASSSTTKQAPANTNSVSKQQTNNKIAQPKQTATNNTQTALPKTGTTSTNDTQRSLPQNRTTQPQSSSNSVTKPSTTQNRTVSSSKSRSYSSSDYVFSKGDNLLNVGLGLSSYYYGNPIGISFEKGIEKDISVGVQLDYDANRNYGYSGGYRAYYLGARGSIHLTRLLKIRVEELDLYAGLGLGFRNFRWRDSYYGSSSGLFFNYFIGGKYYFTNKLGGFAELGYTGLSSVRIGLAVKF